MSTRIRSIVPGSFGLTATRDRGVSVPEISSDASTSSTTAFTTGTSTIGATAVVSGAASAVVDGLEHAAAIRDEPRARTVEKRTNTE
jgi:hypothetical protein